MEFVRTCISLGKEQKEFLKDSPYCLSKLVQYEINKLMKISEGQDFRSQPSDVESTEEKDSSG